MVSLLGYPSSPPPSRQRSDHGTDREKLSGANHFINKSPVASPTDRPATNLPERLNMSFHHPLNAHHPHQQQHPPPPYSAISQVSPTEHSSAHLHQQQQQQRPRPLLQSAQYSSLSHPSPSSAVSIHSPSDRFPSMSAMLAPDSRYSRYSFSSPTDERRLSSDASDMYSTKYASPQSLPSATTYSAPSYTLHRVGRSGSFSDYGKEAAAAAAITAASMGRPDWQDGKERIGRDERSTGAAGFDPYSPIQSSFSSSNSSIATPGLHSPHASSYLQQHQHHGSRGGYVNASVSGMPYQLYGSSEDLSYDSRPHSSSGESNSPSYAYSHVAGAAGAGVGPGGLPHGLDAAASYGNPNDASKTYSFVSLPGNTIRKRPRRRYDEIERLYSCNFPGCTKAYGTLNHLNAHVNMQKHGQKRHPNGKSR